MWSSAVPYKIAFVGSPSSGKSFLINSLLESSCILDEDYLKLCAALNDSPKDKYQNKTSYSFEGSDADLTFESASSFGAQNESKYESHTNYEFESADVPESFSTRSLDSNVESLVVWLFFV